MYTAAWSGFTDSAFLKTSIASSNFPWVLKGAGVKSDVQCATWKEKYCYSLGFERSRCRKRCTVCGLGEKISTFVRFWRIQVSKVMYCVRPRKEKYQYSIGFEGSTRPKWCTVCNLGEKITTFLRFWRVQVAKVLYCVRPGRKSISIP